MQVLGFLLAIGLVLWSSEASKLLVVFKMPARSHANLGDAVVRHLLNAGHEVTYVTAFKYKDPPPKLRLIDISQNIDLIPPSSQVYNLNTIMMNGTTVSEINGIKEIVIKIAVKTVENDNVQRLLKDPNEKFDAVIIEWLYTDLLSGISTVFNAPLIWIHPLDVGPDIIGLIDAMPNPTVAPDILNGVLHPLTFWQRVNELWNRLKVQYLNWMYYDDIESKEYQRLLAPFVRNRGREPPAYSEVRYNASLILGNTHVSTGRPLGFPQSFKPIGGFHIDENVKPLPADVKHKMDNAKHGVIYFSMGSNLKSMEWPEEIKLGLLKMFGELNQTVIWKFEEKLSNTPKNVHILHWAPQSSILSHPNCVLFISHGGLLSTTETVHFGVPIIGMPAFGDQFINVKMAVSKGFAIKVDLTFNLVRDLKLAIDEMLRHSSYTERVKELSFIYHHRPMKPGAELVHWVEHVVHTKGAPHLRSPGLSTPLYQRLYLDLAACIVGISIVLFVLLRPVLCIIESFKKRVTNYKKNN